MSETRKTGITLADLRARREEILRVAARRGAHNLRVFGSVARGAATASSDVDIIAVFQEGTSIFDVVSLWQDLRELLGCEVDLIADHPDGGRAARAARREAVPL